MTVPIGIVCLQIELLCLEETWQRLTRFKLSFLNLLHQNDQLNLLVEQRARYCVSKRVGFVHQSVEKR